MFKVTVTISQPYIKVVISKQLFWIILIRLPLCALFPESITTITAFVAITETMLKIIRLTLQYLITINLILETMSNFMSNSRTYRLTSTGIHPQSTNCIIIARACCKPFSLIQQVNFHFIFVQIRFTLSQFSKFQLFNICFIELFCFFQ